MMKKLALSLFKSADEKLRSFGVKHHSATKPNVTGATNTYRGALTESLEPNAPSTTLPDEPTPSTASESVTNYLRDGESKSVSDISTDFPPPLYPKPQVTQMAERRIQRQSRNEPSRSDSTLNENGVAKRRSRSEGPRGRRRVRNSMHETSGPSRVPKHPSDARHSMFTGHISDEHDEEKVYLAGSDSPESGDGDRKQWTKNPLMIKRTKRVDKNGAENRKSLRSIENGLDHENMKYPKRSSRDNKSNPASKKKDLYMFNEKNENSANLGQKSKFQKLEERRNKRIDITVTSDEECSPQLRISRLRQRAMMSSKMFDQKENQRDEPLNIYPAYSRSALDENLDHRIANARQTSYDDVDIINYRNGNYNEENINLNKYSYSPAVEADSKRHRSSEAEFRHNQLSGRRILEHPHGGILTYPPVQNQQIHRASGSKFSSDSPPMRSFNEVRANKPQQLKKAVGKIELNPRSPNSSTDDSLDELIESNIQYLESEIESGKLKRQSESVSDVPDNSVLRTAAVQQQSFSPKNSLTASEEIKVRLKGPSAAASKHVATLTKFEPVPRFVRRSNSYSATSSNAVSNIKQNNDQSAVYLNPNAAYSPYMRQRSSEIQEDMSKSDSQLNTMNRQFETNQNLYRSGQSFAPYPVLNEETGNVIYVQPAVYNQPSYSTSESNISLPSVDGGMFSDVEYNIEVSERIKKWEKKVKPDDLEDHSSRSILNTIQEFESYSDTNQKETIETPLEIRRELRQLTEHPDTSGVGKLSINLTSSSPALSHVEDYIANDSPYFKPKIVSSETNLHRIFRVVQEPRHRNIHKGRGKSSVRPRQEGKPSVGIAAKPTESKSSQSLGNVALSETEMGQNLQQTWPPMTVDSDSGVRKSWRMSRYEDEIHELKEMVSDNFRDLKKKFDSDVSETDSKRDSTPVRTIPIQIKEKFEKGRPLALNVEQAISKTKSPVPPRRKRFDTKFKTPPTSPGFTRVIPKFESKPEHVKRISDADEKPPPEVWSPNLESRKGLVSMERVKARTLQTIPFSEDPVWKEMEGLTTFNKGASVEDMMREIDFNDIDALLESATKRSSNLDSSNIELSKAEKLMTSSFSQNQSQSKAVVPETKASISSEPSVQNAGLNSKSFRTPLIRPLKLQADIPPRKTSASALDEVLEDIRSTLQKKTLSPKLLKNFDNSDSNSSTNRSLQSPHTKSFKFDFPKNEKPVQKVAMDTDELENTLENTLQTNKKVALQQPKPYVNVPYIDPDFTQYPYIINGNYHLDPSLLTEKLKRTGLAYDLSDEMTSKFAYQSKPSVNTTINRIEFQPVSKQNKVTRIDPRQNKVSSENKSGTHDIDQSVVELKGLAQEVEQKLSQIKSRIISADEERLDSVLLALRKFAPMTEQKYFDVRFTPYEASRAKKNKLEDALSELEKMYKILDLDDASMLDRASRIEETSMIARQEHLKNDSASNRKVLPSTNTSDGNIYRRSQIEEVERQTQNEFEDITKSFQVLIDEVTRQCQAVAQGSKHCTAKISDVTDITQNSKSSLKDMGCNPYSQAELNYDGPSQRSVQDNYNTAIKELEAVAKGPTKPTKSEVYVNLSSVHSNRSFNKMIDSEITKTEPAKNLNIQIQSKAVTSPATIACNDNVKTVQSLTPRQSATNVAKSKASQVEDTVSRQNERTDSKSRAAGRFHRRSNPEHRKSMPVFTRSVETQTMETETVNTDRQNNLAGFSDGSEVKVPVKRKLSKGIAKMVDIFSSSEDERCKASNMRHSHSAPDLTSIDDSQFSHLAILSERRKFSKGSTPRSVKQRHESKSRFRSLKDDGVQDDMTSSVTSEDGMLSPVNKPPVYPNWKYPGQTESLPQKKVERREVSAHEVIKAASDTEREIISSNTTSSAITRRRTRSASDNEDIKRPRSFHELMATFETDPKRLEKMKTCALRKCVSEDSMFTDLVLRKIYHSDTDLSKNELGKKRSASGLKLALEIQVRGEK